MIKLRCEFINYTQIIDRFDKWRWWITSLRYYLEPDGGPDALEPDSYDAEGHLTINSWELFKEDELARELDNED